MHSTVATLRLPVRYHALASMASLLERLDARPRQASADQYRAVAHQVGELLAAAEPGPHLAALLGLCRAAAEIYENQQYAHAGLCRSPLEAALTAERAASAAIERVRRLRAT